MTTTELQAPDFGQAHNECVGIKHDCEHSTHP